MGSRTLPPGDVYATCPFDGSVKDYYANVFDAVYVALSPFIRPSRLAAERFCPERYPTKSELLASCDPVAWSEVVRLSGLPSLAAVDVALRTQIHGLRGELQNPGYAKQLESLYETGTIMPPGEGEHSPFLYAPVLTIFKDLGHEWVWVGDELCTERKLHWIQDLIDRPSEIKGLANMFTPDRSLLWSVHWDSHFSFICGSRFRLDEVRLSERVEGFWCEDETEVYWSVSDYRRRSASGR